MDEEKEKDEEEEDDEREKDEDEKDDDAAPFTPFKRPLSRMPSAPRKGKQDGYASAD